MTKMYKGWNYYKGYPAANAFECWIGDKGTETLYAKTLKELKEKIDKDIEGKNKSGKNIPINMESIEAIAKHMKQEVDDLYKNK